MKTKLIRIERKRLAVEMMGGKCSICGYDKNLASLDFHHKDSTTKEASIGNMVAHHLWDKVKIELEKCVLLCRNCHSDAHNPDLRSETNCNKVKILNEAISGSLKSTCEFCGNQSYGHRFCSQKCSKIATRKVERPSKDQLKLDMETLSLTKIGLKYGVSDNAVRKWAKQYKIF